MVQNVTSLSDELLLEEASLKNKLITLLAHQKIELPSNFKAEWKHLSDRLDTVLAELESLGL